MKTIVRGNMTTEFYCIPRKKSKRGTSYFTITSTRALSDSYIISYKLYGFTEKENISPMQFSIPEIRLGTFNEVKGVHH